MERIKAIIAERIETEPEYDYGIEQCWKKMMQIVRQDKEKVLSFIESVASDEEVYWLSEILCDMYDMMNDDRLVKAFAERAFAMTDAEMKRSVLQEINHI